jgi:hypothetical protein
VCFAGGTLTGYWNLPAGQLLVNGLYWENITTLLLSLLFFIYKELCDEHNTCACGFNVMSVMISPFWPNHYEMAGTLRAEKPRKPHGWWECGSLRLRTMPPCADRGNCLPLAWHAICCDALPIQGKDHIVPFPLFTVCTSDCLQFVLCAFWSLAKKQPACNVLGCTIT